MPPDSRELFELVVTLVEQVAALEYLVVARERELEPDSMARALFTDPEWSGVRSAASILEGVSEQDLTQLETILRRLEGKHGTALQNLPNHRMLIDGAVLGRVGFLYNRKFREVLASRKINGAAKGGILSDLVLQVDELYPAGRPRYLWRLGPEFGVDANVRFLLERNDEFIVRCLYRSRARRLARDVLKWREIRGVEIGENPLAAPYQHPVRQLVVEGNGPPYLLLTNMHNVSWERIYRLYTNRSGKYASMVQIPRERSERSAAVWAMVIALFLFRNFKTWALTPDEVNVAVAREHEQQRVVSLVDSPSRGVLLDQMEDTLEYLSGYEVRPTPTQQAPAYEMQVPDGLDVTSAEAGWVYYVDDVGKTETGRHVIVYHGNGYSTVYGNLSSVGSGIVAGAEIGKGDVLGRIDPADDAFLYFQARVAQRFVDKGFEPAAWEVISSESNFMLDPLNACAEPPVEKEDDEARDLVRVPVDLGDVDLMVIEGDDMSLPIIFAMPFTRNDPEVIIADVLDDYFVGGDVLGVDVS